ncbi:hypothetical protein NC653_028490 [Populus alba x Populus x berolinensis]|uniref:Translation initiation factor eIF2B subunit delta n=1 Tax=Populus alba x Populus x berolinensis TaxID=444605 RepID=A0AAD6M101_9ROSI|nr:hypothetical protein NC653_028490 [Populus alba x Populus x berolinensis]
MHDVTRVFFGSSSVLSNGTVYSRVGTACVAMVAHAFHVPVLICCEAYKFHERVLLDSICSNELGLFVSLQDQFIVLYPLITCMFFDYERKIKEHFSCCLQVIQIAISKVPGRKDINFLDDLTNKDNLQLLNLMYDATPSEYVSMIITDYGMIPPTSVPVIVREYGMSTCGYSNTEKALLRLRILYSGSPAWNKQDFEFYYTWLEPLLIIFFTSK